MAAGGTGSRCGSSLHLPDLRIVLLGNRASGKTSVANAILGRERCYLIRTAKNVKSQGQAAGRLLTVVDTPGWWKNFSLKDTPEWRRQEMVLSVNLCPPGPHAFLLVIRLDSFYRDVCKGSAQEHLGMLSERVWSHAIVLFTYGDKLDERLVEQMFGTEAETLLQRLVGKCGNRYHVLNIESENSFSQVVDLLEKIEEMVASNGGHHYQIDNKAIVDVLRRRTAVERQANERRRTAQEAREDLQGLMGLKKHLNKVRIILLGARRAGKSSAGNTLLGRARFDQKRTTACVKRQGEAAGRQLTVVDTPGWWRPLPVRESPELLKQELLHSLCVCAPRAHAIVLAVRSDVSFTEEERRAVEEHLELLGERVWNHTVVLFTCADSIGEATIEQHIESEGKALLRLIEKCGNRYHLFNNENWGDGSQVTELLEKIEEMVACNGSLPYEKEKKIFKELWKKRRAVEKRAKTLMKEQERRTKVRSLIGGQQHLSELSIVLLGYGASGKTSTGNTILGREEFGSQRTYFCMKRQGEVAGRFLTLVDTAGWWKNFQRADTPKENRRQIKLSMSMCPPGPQALLLVVRLDSSFKEEERRATEEHVQMLGSGVWDLSMVLFTCGDWLGDTSLEMHIEMEGRALQWLVGKCGNRYHVFNNKNKSEYSQVSELLEKIEEMVYRGGGCHDMDALVLKEVTDRRRSEEERAEEKAKKEWNRRERLEAESDDVMTYLHHAN